MLARQFPAHVAPVLAVEPEQKWLLTAEMAGRPLYETFDLADWHAAMQTMGQIQLQLVDQVEALMALGCFDRRLEKFAERLRPFQAAAPNFHLAPGLFDRLAPQVDALCQQVAEHRIPATLEHGDFHPNNIYTAGGKPVFFDWADGALSHPFFSPVALLGYVTLTAPDMAAQVDGLRDAYLQPWTVYKPLAELKTLFELIRPLATLHYALNMFECWQGRRPPADPVEPEMLQAVATCMQMTENALTTG